MSTTITVAVLARLAVDQEFAELVAPVVVPLTSRETGYTPHLPPEAAGRELRLRVTDVPTGLSIKIGRGVDPAAGIEPPYGSRTVGIWPGYSRDIPFGQLDSFLFRHRARAAA